jgi:iron(III) transport system ATP-binding protein
VIREIGNNLQITCLMVSHDPSDILSWADEIILMKAGKIVQQGTPEGVYRYPVDAYAAGLLGNYYTLSPHLSNAFRKNEGVHENGKSIFVRPEYFKIVSENEGLEAIVKEKFFMAGIYELELVIADTIITIRTMQKHPKKGDKIYIALEKEVLEN